MESIPRPSPSGGNARALGPTDGAEGPHSTVRLADEETLIVAFRRHTLLPLDACLYALQATVPHLTRSSLHRLFQRHAVSRLPNTGGTQPRRKGQGLSDGVTSTSISRRSGPRREGAIAYMAAEAYRRGLMTRADLSTEALSLQVARPVRGEAARLRRGGSVASNGVHGAAQRQSQ